MDDSGNPPTPSIPAAAAHDLRTPLTVIKAQTSILSRRFRDDPVALHALDMIADQAEQLARTVELMIQLARAEAMPMALEVASVDFARLLRGGLRELHLEGELSALEIDDAIPMIGDVPALKLLVSALLSNAARHSPEGRPIDVRAQAIDGELRLSVHHHCGDVDPALAATFVGRRFSRVPAHPGRLGVGLAVVRSIAEAHGGTVRIEAVPDDGICVRVQLPRRV
jgi:two-component system OmpR family sensor kinase